LRRHDWGKAHEIVMGLRDKLAFRLHGLAHLIEGDSENARYWYDRAGVEFSESGSFESEIDAIAKVLTNRPRGAAATRTGTRRSRPRRSGSRRSRA